MTTYLAATLTLLLLVLVIGLLERTNRRSASGLPHEPLGVDGRRDADLSRLLHDLDAHRW